MNAFTSNASLVLYPDDPNWTPEDPDVCINFLQEIKLAGNNLDKEEMCFLVGDKFLDYISFMGCSPNIKFNKKNNDEKFTFIRIILSESVTALTGKHSFSPLCPQCKKPNKNWRENLEDNQLVCNHCQTTSDAWQFNWRKSACFARCFIEITDIYPKEAIPQPSLLTALEKKFQTSWAYCFYHP